MKILFIQTGGTIDKDYPKTVKGYAFEIGEPAVKRILEKVNPNFDYEVVPLLQKDSMDLTDEDRELIRKTCESAIAEKIVITHGTDTMTQTAKVLSTLQNKTILITGAMRPEKFVDSDAMFNLGCAITALQTLPFGVYVTMNGRVYKWNEVEKNQNTGQFVENRHENA